MKTAYLVLSLASMLMGAQMAMARTMVMKPGETVRQLPAPQPHSVMSMGKIDAINLNARTVRINAVNYSIPDATRFVSVSGAAQLKAGDWIHFWIKPEMAQHIPVIDKVELLSNPEIGRAKP